MDYETLTDTMFEMIVSSARLPYQKATTDFSKGETAILFSLISCGSLSPGKICGLLGIGSGRTADALKSLETKRLIGRKSDEYDKRKVVVFITDKGRIFIENRREEAKKKIRETLLMLGEDDSAELVRIMSKINSLCEK